MYNRIMEINLTKKSVDIYEDTKIFDKYLGGTGAGTKLLCDSKIEKANPLSEENVILFATGPFNSFYPVATKTVALFKSPLTGNLGESHAGGRFFLGMYGAGINVLKITGKASEPMFLDINNDDVKFVPCSSLWGMSAPATDRILRERTHTGKEKTSIIKIGRAGERQSYYASVLVDSSRHFGRLGLGAVMGSKNLKAIVIQGDSYEKLKDKKAYNKVYKEIYDVIMRSEAMKKYHDLGTPQNIAPLSKLGGLPTRNFSQGYFESDKLVSGERFADEYLEQQIACAHCQIGCIHLGTYREMFAEHHQFKTTLVSYDYELIYALGTNLSVNSPEDILKMIEYAEKESWDIMSLGVVLAWATEVYQKGIITDKQTELTLHFGDTDKYLEVMKRMRDGYNEFYRDLEKGVYFCAEKYGGKEYAIHFGKNEAPGYMTGDNSYIGFLTGVRHSHLDNAGYSLDQKLISGNDMSEEEQMKKLVDEALWRMIINSLVLCLFARNVYTEEVILKGLSAIQIDKTGEELSEIAKEIHTMKMKFKIDCGFDFDELDIPQKLYSITTPLGNIDKDVVKRKIMLYKEMIGF